MYKIDNCDVDVSAHDSGPVIDDGHNLARFLTEVFRREDQELFLVGGAVRDRLLDRAGSDLDFATSSHPDETARILAGLNLGRPYRIGERFGTIGLPLNGRLIEITTYRREETYALNSRKPLVRFGRSLHEDLKRRDFTVNAMALDPLTDALIDPFGGHADLERQVIRAVGEPDERFREDPLRLLRAIRFATKLTFSIEEETWQAMVRQAHSLPSISRERIRDEFSGILIGPRPVVGLTLLRDCGLLQIAVPELMELTLMPDHGPSHPLSLWDHTMRVLAAVPPSLTVRWAALLHDIAKPTTRTHEPDGRIRFFGHEELGATIARNLLLSLRYPNVLISDVSLLVETHMQIHAYSSEWSDGAVRRLMVRLGVLLSDAIALARADAAGHTESGKSVNEPRYEQLIVRIEELNRANPETLRSPLSGEDLMARYGRPPGVWIRRIKDALREEVMEGRLPPNDRERAWMLADELEASGG
ncbi:MAG: CCA tRNA nucleotidyltransferase [Chloroflexota bacterium]